MIDYSDVDGICGYQMLLCKMFEQAGGFSTCPVASKEIVAIRREGMSWLREVGNIMESILASGGDDALGLGALPRIIESYDIFYRVCHGIPCLGYVRGIRLKAADRWAAGDKNITAAKVALMLRKEIIRDPRTLPPRYLAFCDDITATWIDSLRRHGTLADTTQEDTYLALGTLLSMNLAAYGVTDDEKRQWIETHTLDEAAIPGFDVNTLWTYMDFDRNAAQFQGLPLHEQDKRYFNFLTLISLHPATNRFTREAIGIELVKSE